MGGDCGAGAGASSGGRNAWEAASLVCRIATVGLSLASAIMTAASTKCLYRSDGSPAGSVSYSDYGSFKYSALANLLSAALQGVAIWLEVVGKEKWAKTVELIDKLVLALTSTSAPLLFAVDNITSCGGGRRSGSRGVCDMAGSFCRQLRLASLPSLGAVGFSVAVQYTSWRAARVEADSVAGQTAPARRRARGPPRGAAGTVVVGTGGGGGGGDDGHGGGGGGQDQSTSVAPIYTAPTQRGPAGNVPDSTGGGGGGGGGDGGGGGGGGHPQGTRSDKDPKGKGNGVENGGGGGGGDRPKIEGNKGENKAGGGEITVKGPGEERRMEGADPRPPVLQQNRLTGHEVEGGDGAGESFHGEMRYKTQQRKDKGDRGGEDRAGAVVEVEDHREEEIQVQEAVPAVPPGGNVVVFRRTRG